ncbi:MAG TPA: Na-translocating system protein MpsC family protein [Thermoleophilaceae bacterium]|nr:Na-translocating system protein MpsC family protein [Thermoleophilaceae bacterium]
MEYVEAPEGHARVGDDLAEITNGIVRLFSEYYGRGPTRAKTYMLENRYVVTVLRDTMTKVERTLAERGEQDMVRRVRLTFQEAMAASFKGVVEEALGRRVEAYHSQILIEPDVGFEFFMLEE